MRRSGNGFEDANGISVRPGDCVEYQYGGFGILIEAFQDGDAYVQFEDGQEKLVKWKHLCFRTQPVELPFQVIEEIND